jgi:hypothetical protein
MTREQLSIVDAIRQIPSFRERAVNETRLEKGRKVNAALG